VNVSRKEEENLIIVFQIIITINFLLNKTELASGTSKHSSEILTPLTLCKCYHNN